MKFMLILFSVFAFQSTSTEDPVIEFEKTLKSGYEEYALYQESINNYYDLKLYVGKYDEKIYYSVYFRNETPNQPYNINLSYNNKTYNLKQTSRSDVFEAAILINNAEKFSINIYDHNKNKQARPEFTNINNINLNDFSSLEGRINGNGDGFNLSRLRSDYKISDTLFIYLVLVSILLICGSIILVFYKKRKGLFNSDLKSANVFNFKEFLNSAQEEIHASYEEAEVVEEKSIYEAKEADIYKNDEAPKEKIVNQTYVWQHYEEEKSDFDIKEYLNKLNLPTDYKDASAENKNKIMLELMKLRDQNKITHDDYLDEISELWKN